MFEADVSISYSIAVFIIVFFSGCAVNLLKQHFILQLTGIAFLFTVSVIKMYMLLEGDPDISLKAIYFSMLPLLSGMSACLISMIFGFLLFPSVRKIFKS